MSSVPADMAPLRSLALDINEEHLKLQSDAVGMVLFYLEEERRMLQEKHAAWLSQLPR